MTPATRNRLWLAAALLLTAGKLWLTRGQGVHAIGGAAGEDLLTVELAQHVIRGEWLGPYHDLTLTQGPFYPLFIAAVFWTGVPLFLAQHLFYAAACGLFVLALRPALSSAGARLALYAVLLANPMSFDGPGMARVFPLQVQGPLALMIFAGLVALHLRRDDPVRQQAPWAILLGLAGAAFYLTGEARAWFVPGALLLAGAHFFVAKKISPAAAQNAARWLGVALAVAVLPVLVVCFKNQRAYGRFATSEQRPAEAAAAPGAPAGPGFVQKVDFVTSFSRFSARVPPSTGTPEQLQLFRDVTHERLSPPVGELDKVGAARYILNGEKVEGLQRIGKALRPVLTALFWLAQVLWLVRMAWLARHRRWNFPLTVAAAAWIACAAFLILQTPAMPSPGSALTSSAFAPVYLLLHVFIIALLWEALAAWRNRGTESPTTSAPAPAAG